MRWRINGVEGDTGKRRIAIVEAASKTDARNIGLEAGLSDVRASLEVEGKLSGSSILSALIILTGLLIGCVNAFKGFDLKSARQTGQLMGIATIGSAILAVLVTPFARYLRKLGYEKADSMIYALTFGGLFAFAGINPFQAARWTGSLIVPLLFGDVILILFCRRNPSRAKAMLAFAAGLPILGLHIAKSDAPNPAFAIPQLRNALNDMRSHFDAPTRPAEQPNTTPYIPKNTFPTNETIQSSTSTSQSKGFLQRLGNILSSSSSPNASPSKSSPNAPTRSTPSQSALPGAADGTRYGEMAPFMQLTREMTAEVSAEAQKYQATIRPQEISSMLSAETLVNAQRRASARQSVARMRKNLKDYEQAIFILINRYATRLETLNLRPDLKASLIKGAAEGRLKAVDFIHSHIAIEADIIDEFDTVLDVMDRAEGKCSLVRTRISFDVTRDLEDYTRSMQRIQRLANLESTRAKDYQASVRQELDNGLAALEPNSRLQKKLAVWSRSNRSGTSVALDSDSITVNGKRISISSTPQQLTEAFGKAPRQTGLDPVKYTWDDLGLAAWQRSGSQQISGLIIAVNSRNSQNWPSQSVRGSLSLSGMTVDENATPLSLNRKLKTAKFETAASDGKRWALNFKNYRITTTFKKDGSIDSLVLEPRTPAPAGQRQSLELTDTAESF